MKKKILFFLLISITIASSLKASTLTGKVYDNSNVKNVAYAMVSIIRSSDSILIKHVRTNQEGIYTINNIDSGKYILLVTHSKYGDFYDNFTIGKDENKDLGTTNLYDRGKLLSEVIIRDRNAIKIKGDTLEYLVDSFKVREGAVVEDLLKVLPGIQVNKNGEITAQGEKVQKVLVDGEEFFGDDPTVATQNIQSKVVDKIQVFDRKSDQAQFTGFDDENTEKTINLKLKKNMNKGTFGKIVGGIGDIENTHDIWNNQFMINNFKNKRQLSAYGLMNSLGKVGLGWEDKNKYASDGNSGGMGMDEDGAFNFSFDSGDEDGGGFDWGRSSSQAGRTRALNGGLHYADKWNEGKQHLNTNYSFSNVIKKVDQRNYTENILPTSKQFTGDTSNAESTRNIHKLTGKYEWIIDSSLTIIYNLNARLNKNESATKVRNQNKRDDGNIMNEGGNTNTSTSDSRRVNNDITFNKKLKKTGRTLSLNANLNINSNESDGFLNSNNTFYSTPTQSFSRIIDQEKKSTNTGSNIGATITYTEPLSKKFFLKTSYAISSDNSHMNKATLEKNALSGGEYVDRIDALSNDFLFSMLRNTVRADLKYQEKKYFVTLGLGVANTYFKQIDKINPSSDYNYTRNNLFPTVRFNYKFDQFKRLTVTYTGSTKQPSIDQLQPIQDNTNPLEVYIGNPDLLMSYSQSINGNYFSYKALSARSFWAGAFISNNLNSISLNRTYDQFGKTVNKYVNLKSSYNASVWSGFGSRIKSSAFETRVNLNGNYNYSPTIVNGIEGNTNTYSVTTSPSLTYNKEDKIYISMEHAITYSVSQNSLTTNRNIKYITYNPNASITYYLPKSFEVTTDVDYTYRPAVAPYNTNFQRTVWNANISKRILKGKTLVLKAEVNDMLNQNKGYERTTTNNYNQEQFFNTLGRYWLVSATWNFNTSPMTSKKGPAVPRGARPPGGRRQGRGRR
jgi:hypothetical protein